MTTLTVPCDECDGTDGTCPKCKGRGAVDIDAELYLREWALNDDGEIHACALAVLATLDALPAKADQ